MLRHQHDCHTLLRDSIRIDPRGFGNYQGEQAAGSDVHSQPWRSSDHSSLQLIRENLKEVRETRNKGSTLVAGARTSPRRGKARYYRLVRTEGPCCEDFAKSTGGGEGTYLPIPSIAFATRSIVPSLKCPAITCTPIGSPSEVSPHGTLTPQIPARLAATE